MTDDERNMAILRKAWENHYAWAKKEGLIKDYKFVGGDGVEVTYWPPVKKLELKDKIKFHIAVRLYDKSEAMVARYSAFELGYVDELDRHIVGPLILAAIECYNTTALSTDRMVVRGEVVEEADGIV